jgi:hypothetical protein
MIQSGVGEYSPSTVHIETHSTNRHLLASHHPATHATRVCAGVRAYLRARASGGQHEVRDFISANDRALVERFEYGDVDAHASGFNQWMSEWKKRGEDLRGETI